MRPRQLAHYNAEWTTFPLLKWIPRTHTNPMMMFLSPITVPFIFSGSILPLFWLIRQIARLRSQGMRRPRQAPRTPPRHAPHFPHTPLSILHSLVCVELALYSLATTSSYANWHAHRVEPMVYTKEPRFRVYHIVQWLITRQFPLGAASTCFLFLVSCFLFLVSCFLFLIICTYVYVCARVCCVVLPYVCMCAACACVCVRVLYA